MFGKINYFFWFEVSLQIHEQFVLWLRDYWRSRSLNFDSMGILVDDQSEKDKVKIVCALAFKSETARKFFEQDQVSSFDDDMHQHWNGRATGNDIAYREACEYFFYL